MKKRFRWDITYLYWGITAFSVIACGVIVFILLDRWPAIRDGLADVLRILSPVLYGLIFAYLLNKMMSMIEKKLISRLINKIFRKSKANSRRRMIRIVSIVLTVIFTVVLIGGILMLVIPQILSSLESLLPAIAGYRDDIIAWLTYTFEDNSQIEGAAVNYARTILDWLEQWIDGTLLRLGESFEQNVIGGALSVIRTVANIVIGFVLSIYALYQKETFAAQSKKIIYSIFGVKKGNRIILGATFLDNSCGSFLTARLLDAIIVGILCYLFLIISNLPYPMLIAVIVGVTNIIPFFGPFIGGIPSGLLILMVSPTQCLIFIVFIVILQQLDGNVIYPKIQGSALGLSGFWIIVSLLVFSGFIGFWGMILGVPIFTAIYAICKGAASKQLANRGMPTNTDAYRDIASFDEETNEPVLKTSSAPKESTDAPASVRLRGKLRSISPFEPGTRSFKLKKRAAALSTTESENENRQESE